MSSLTPEIATFSNRIAAVEGRDDFTDADAICDLAASRRSACQVQNVLWDPVDHPEWVIVWIRDQSPDERRRTMTRYVRRVVRHFANRSDTVTVLNEDLDANGGLQGGAWNTTVDDHWVFKAFRAARRADPSAQLFYNDFGVKDVNAKSDAVLALVRRLRPTRVRVDVGGGRVRRIPLIDGVGLQFHVGVAPGQAPEPASVAATSTAWPTPASGCGSPSWTSGSPSTPTGRHHRRTSGPNASCTDAWPLSAFEPRPVTASPSGASMTGHSWITENAASFPGARVPPTCSAPGTEPSRLTSGCVERSAAGPAGKRSGATSARWRSRRRR